MTIATSEEPNLERFWSIEEASTSSTQSEQTDTAFIYHYQIMALTQLSFHGKQFIIHFHQTLQPLRNEQDS